MIQPFFFLIMYTNLLANKVDSKLCLSEMKAKLIVHGEKENLKIFFQIWKRIGFERGAKDKCFQSIG